LGRSTPEASPVESDTIADRHNDAIREIADKRQSALIQRADQMLYEAKNKGRNRTMIWSSATESR
jgi:GGDEF domain-containing protein